MYSINFCKTVWAMGRNCPWDFELSETPVLLAVETQMDQEVEALAQTPDSGTLLILGLLEAF
jgi:hypothetical protein